MTTIDIFGNDYKCPYCGNHYSSSKSLNSHKYKYHREAKLQETDKKMECLKKLKQKRE